MGQPRLRWTEVRVGVIVLVALASLVALILNLQPGSGFMTRQVEFRAVVPHSEGLKVGGPVRVSGVDVGNIRKIAIGTETPRVEIVFTVERRAAGHVRQDATVMIRPMGLLGDKFLEVHPGTPSQPELPEGSRLTGVAQADLTSLATDASGTLEQVNQALGALQRVLTALDHGQGTAGKLLTDTQLYERSQELLERLEVASETAMGLLGKLQRGEGTLGQLVTDQGLYTRADHALQELMSLTSLLNNQNGTLAKLTDPKLYSRLDAMTARGEELLQKIERGDGTMGKLVTRDDLYARMEKVLTDVELLVADVKKNPKKYFSFSVF